MPAIRDLIPKRFHDALILHLRNKNTFPDESGLYAIVVAGEAVYVGFTTGLRDRFKKHNIIKRHKIHNAEIYFWSGGYHKDEGVLIVCLLPKYNINQSHSPINEDFNFWKKVFARLDQPLEH